MQRTPRPPDASLQALMDERDHLRIQISLAEHSDLPHSEQLADLRR